MAVLLMGSLALAALPQQGWHRTHGELVSPEKAGAVFEFTGSQSRFTQVPTALGHDEPAADEIAELARSLKYDHELMSKFVHDHIEYAPYFGSAKGAHMTLMDRSGNSFDQASLLIRLLREAGYDANYVFGTIRVSLDVAADWLGVSPEVHVVKRLLADAGIPGEILMDDEENSYAVELSHVWAKILINGATYVADPSMKNHHYNPGIDLQSAMGYDRHNFLTAATSGAIINPDYVQRINKTKLSADLAA